MFSTNQTGTDQTQSTSVLHNSYQNIGSNNYYNPQQYQENPQYSQQCQICSQNNYS